MKDVYITRTSSFFPNSPVSNEEMEEVIGQIGGKSSRAKKIILKNNKIKTRYYCYDKKGDLKYNNAELTKQAILKLMEGANLSLLDINLLCTATTNADQFIPSHASMVHGLLPKMGSVEIYSPNGVCATSIQGLKIAYMHILSGLNSNAICTGSEFASALFRSAFFDPQYKKIQKLSKNPYIGFEGDFLRFMLSDGAGAFLLEDKPNGEINYKIEWIEGRSFADTIPTCMYQGCLKDENNNLVSWRETDPTVMIEENFLSLKQDVRILEKHVVKSVVELQTDVLKKHCLDSSDVDYYLPHISSMHFKEKLYNAMEEDETPISKDKWFLNLPDIGNVGSASIFCLLHDLAKHRDIKKGQKVLLMVPESARFNHYNVLLTIV